MQLERLSTEQLATMLNESKILETDGYGPKVARLNNGLFLKLIRRKKFWKANEANKIQRFCRHARLLIQRQIKTLQPQRIFNIPEQKKAGVLYQPLDGTPLRHALAQANPQDAEAIIAQLASFIYRLHTRGIYFRSLHADNILRTPDGDFGLIDILDMQFSKGPLSIFKCTRNFQHLFRLNNLTEWHQKIVFYYIHAAQLTGWRKNWLLLRLAKSITH